MILLLIIFKGIVLVCALYLTYLAIYNDIVIVINHKLAKKKTAQDIEDERTAITQLVVACILWAIFYILTVYYTII